MRIFLLCSAILILSIATLTTTATKPVVASFEPLPLPDEPGVVVLPLDAKVVRDSRGRVTCPMKGSSQRKECGYPEGVCCAELGMCCPQGFRCRQRGAFTTCARAVPVAHSPGVGQTVVDPDLTQVIVRPIIHINTMSAPKVDDVIDAAEMTREANEKPMDDVIAAAKEKRQNVLWHNRNEVFRGYPDQLAAQAAAKAALSNKANAIPPPSKKKFRNAPKLVDTDPKDAVPAHDADIDAVE